MKCLLCADSGPIQALLFEFPGPRSMDTGQNLPSLKGPCSSLGSWGDQEGFDQLAEESKRLRLPIPVGTSLCSKAGNL